MYSTILYLLKVPKVDDDAAMQNCIFFRGQLPPFNRAKPEDRSNII
jgi:hypothetical protein